MRFFKQPLFALAFAASFAFACSDDAGETDPTPDAGAQTDGGDVETDAGGEGSGEGSGGETGTLEDPTWRLTFVDIKRPIGGIGTILENLIAEDIDADELHILIQFRGFSADDIGGTFEIFGTAGSKVEGGYTWYPGTEPVDSDYKDADILDPASNEGEFCTATSALCFASTEQLSIIFPALEPGATEPLQIPVTELSLTGEVFDDNGEDVLFGLLAGAILADEIADLDVNVSGQPDGPSQPLSDLLGDRTYPTDADDADKTGWVITAEIEAAVTNFVPSN